MVEFFDKVKESIDKGVNVVGVRSKEALESAKLNAVIGSLSGKKKDALEELGSIVYTASQHNQTAMTEEGTAKLGEIADLDAQISAKQAELKKVHLDAKIQLGIPLCGGCHEVVDEDDAFCHKCGKKVE